MKRQYSKPTCTAIRLAMQQPCLIGGSYGVKAMEYHTEQEVGGDE